MRSHDGYRWKLFKRNHHWIMNYRNVDPNAWYLAAKWVAYIMNHTAERSLGYRTPIEVLTGNTPDISIMLCFMFWDVVYCNRLKDSDYHGQVGSEKSSEIRGRFVGFAEGVGHALTFLILRDDTGKVIARSQVRLAKDGENNLKLDALAPERPDREFLLKSKTKEEDDLPTVDLSQDPFVVVEKEDVDSDEQKDDSKTTIPDPKVIPNPTTDLGLPQSTATDETLDHPTNKTEGDTSKTRPQTDGRRKSPRLNKDQRVTVETVSMDEAEKDETLEELPEYNRRSPMNAEKLQDLPDVGDYQDPEEEMADHAKPPQQFGRSNPEGKPFLFERMEDLETHNPTVKDLKPEQMEGRTFLMPPAEDGSRMRAKIVERIQEIQDEAHNDPRYVKFKCLINDTWEEVVAYNDIVDYIERDESWDGMWKFREIIGHKRVPSTNKEYKGSMYNVLVLWEGGTQTWEPLGQIIKDDPVTVALYAKKHGLLGTTGWNHRVLKNIAKTEKRITRRANQAKLHSFRTKPIYMFGYQVPRNHDEAMELDRQNGNTMWRDSEILELSQVDEYSTFLDKGVGCRMGRDWRKINVHFVYAVKHDGRHKSRLVAGGHLTDTPIDSVYSSVVSLKGVRVLTFLGSLNELDLWATDIGNAYLESYTKEKVYIVAGPEFGDREGHVLVISKALYGLRTSGLRWHERYADVMQEMGFFPCKAEPDIWMRDCGDHYEYIGVYVDDLIIASKRCKEIVDTLSNKYGFKLKGTGEVSFHLGCDFFRDEEGNMCYAPLKYIEKMMSNYKRIFGTNPKQYASPLEKGDHPELDTTELLDDEETKIYQSLIGALQWVIQIGRFDIATAVMTLSRFRACPRKGHLDRVKRIHGYLFKMKFGTIRIRTEEPDYSDLPESVHTWEHTVYHDAKEQIPPD